MRRTLLILVCIFPYLLHAQPRIKNKKYQGLLWEISGKGMKKPSYLFGTMHVSSKLAFHLADSFYLGIRNADVVALETNPESWQEDMSKYQTENNDYSSPFRMGSYSEEPDDYLDINTLKFYKYEKKIERALYSNPSMINNLLYRSYGNESSDFEEDTYLDMYIYQCGKKWGKKVAGVEKYGESMKLMAEAYRDAAKDKNKKDRSYNSEGGYSYNKLQEAYRSGNLDWLDSINKYNSISAAFDEKFLYKRNEIQANSIDSILRAGHSLFVGVGAAHLPGNRGVIEMLRAMGYQLRPVKMGARDSQHKSQVEKLRVPITFTTQTSADGVYKVDIPGKFYKFGDDFRTDQEQYADMANGSYYMVTRIMTNAWMWGHSSAKIQKIVDSLLYENVPGKILNKTNITKNGYPGFDITNKTRRGDIQRYCIFVTPFEIIVFKMSGNADYVTNGDEAKRFFGSIQLKEFKSADNGANWKKYSPAYGGFSIDMPHEPFIGNDGSWIYDAEDKSTNTQYRVIRTDIHNYHFVEEDTFDLSLLEESFAASDFIDKKLDRKLTSYKGYPALDCKFSDKNGGVYLTRFIIQGTHYYSLISHGKNENAVMKNFLNSFELKPFHYSAARERKDTSLYFTVSSPVYPDADKEKLEVPGNNFLRNSDNDDDDNDYLVGGTFRSKTIVSDTTGEKVHVEFFRSPRYFYVKDSSIIEKEYRQIGGDSSWIFRVNKKYETADKFKVWESVVSDTGSSRMLWSKIYYKNGLGFSLLTELDTLTPPSSFVKSFYETFKPADTLTGVDLFVKKNKLFFEDFNSRDSATRRKAIKGISMVELDSTDLPALKQAIGSLNWKEKKYLDVKKLLIGKLDDIKTRQSADFAKDLYYAAGDTLELQYAALEVLLKHKNQYAYKVFRDIMVAEPPVIDNNQSYDYTSNSIYAYSDYSMRSGRRGGNFMNGLSDSLPLTKTILADILPLINLDDYKGNMMSLLVEMVDSNLVKPADYQIYFTKFLIEAKQEYKKQAIAEKQKAIEKAEQIKIEGNDKDEKDDDWDNSDGNDDLQTYATLLLPSWDANPQVKVFINQLLSSNDVRLKYNVMMLLLRNNKPCPDSLVKYFAKSDQYRYEFYKDLKTAGLSAKFPSGYNSHLDLAKSKLMNFRRYSDYGNPDSLVYIDRLSLETKGKKGYVYFFKYKFKKDDPSWRLASVGLVPEDANKFEFETAKSKMVSWGYDYEYDENQYQYEYTGYYSTKVKEDQPIKAQINKQLRMMNYSKRKSARNFYNDADDSEEDTDQEQIVISHDE